MTSYSHAQNNEPVQNSPQMQHDDPKKHELGPGDRRDEHFHRDPAPVRRAASRAAVILEEAHRDAVAAEDESHQQEDAERQLDGLQQQLDATGIVEAQEAGETLWTKMVADRKMGGRRFNFSRKVGWSRMTDVACHKSVNIQKL